MTRSKMNVFNQQKGFSVFEIDQGGRPKDFTSSNNEMTPPNPNKTISLDNNALSDYQIVYNSNYPFTIDREVLIESSEDTRRAKKQKRTGSNKAPRPQNSFMLYRRNMSAKLKAESADKKMKAALRSKSIAAMWKTETEEVKALFNALARLAMQRHIEVFGEDYKYRPEPAKRGNKVKGGAKNRVKRAKNNDDTDTDFAQTTDSEFTTNSEQSSPDTSFLDDPCLPIEDSPPTNFFPELSDCILYFNFLKYHNTVYLHTFEQLQQHQLILNLQHIQHHQYIAQDQYFNEEPTFEEDNNEDQYFVYLSKKDQDDVTKQPLSQPEVPFFELEQTSHLLSHNSGFEQPDFITY